MRRVQSLRVCVRVKGLAVLVLAVLGIASAAPAQINSTEPPDLSDNAASPTPVGTVSVGLNMIQGTIATPFSGGSVSQDGFDYASFTVPTNLVVTSVQAVITHYSRTGSPVCRTESPDSLLANSWTFSGNGAGPNMITSNGMLPPGTYSLGFKTVPPSHDSGTIAYTWELHIVAAPTTNDTCQFATPIALGATPFNNTNATTDGLPHAACAGTSPPSIIKDLWYTHVPLADGLLTVTTCGSVIDTELNIYRSGACPGTDETLLACNDDDTVGCATGTFQSRVTIAVAAGSMYLIRVGGYDGGGSTTTSGAGTLTLTLASTPTTGACCNRWTGHCTTRTQADCTIQGLRFGDIGSACSPAMCKACPADFNGSGIVSVQDIFDFLGSYFSGCP